MKALSWNFNTEERTDKSFTDTLKDVKWIVSPYVRLNAAIDECKIVEMFESKTLYVAYPAKALPEGNFMDYELNCNGYWTGLITFEGHALGFHIGSYRRFNIKGDTMYIGKIDR